jgi:hypothetical protein
MGEAKRRAQAEAKCGTGQPVPPTKPLFAWHGAMGAVVFLDPTSDKGLAFPAETLRALGWSGTDADYRHALPRIDPSPLSVMG